MYHATHVCTMQRNAYTIANRVMPKTRGKLTILPLKGFGAVVLSTYIQGGRVLRQELLSLTTLSLVSSRGYKAKKSDQNQKVHSKIVYSTASEGAQGDISEVVWLEAIAP